MNKQPKLYEQADVCGDGFRYSWVLDNVPHGCNLPGWTWVRGVGRRGCYVTKDEAVAQSFASQYQLKIGTNNTHEQLKAPKQIAQ